MTRLEDIPGGADNFNVRIVHNSEYVMTNSNDEPFGLDPDWRGIAQDLREQPLLVAFGVVFIAGCAVEYYLPKAVRRSQELLGQIYREITTS